MVTIESGVVQVDAEGTVATNPSNLIRRELAIKLGQHKEVLPGGEVFAESLGDAAGLRVTFPRPGQFIFAACGYPERDVVQMADSGEIRREMIPDPKLIAVFGPNSFVVTLLKNVGLTNLMADDGTSGTSVYEWKGVFGEGSEATGVVVQYVPSAGVWRVANQARGGGEENEQVSVSVIPIEEIPESYRNHVV